MDTIMKARAMMVIAAAILLVSAALLGVSTEYVSAKEAARPKGIKYIAELTDSECIDGCELRKAKTYLEWKPVKNADGYKIKIKYRGLSPEWSKWIKYSRKKNKLNMDEEVGSNCGYEIKVKVRPYKIRNGKKRTFGKWSKVRYIAAWEVCRTVITDREDKAVG